MATVETTGIRVVIAGMAEKKKKATDGAKKIQHLGLRVLDFGKRFGTMAPAFYGTP